MSWKRVVREVEIAARDSARHQKAVDREGAKRLADLERNVASAKRAIEKALDLLEKDPIKAFTLEYSRASGLSSQDLSIRSKGYETSLTTSLREVKTCFDPPGLEAATVRVTPVGVFADATCTVIAVEVAALESGSKITPGLVNKSNPHDAKVVLVDTASGGYMYPLSTNLIGEVLPGHPRVGLIAFRAVGEFAGDWELHFLRLISGDRNPRPLTFRFSAHHDASAGDGSANGLKVLRTMLMDDLETEHTQGAAMINQRIAEAKGCAVAGSLLVGSSITMLTGLILG